MPVATNQHCHTEGTSVEILTSKGGKGRVVNLLVEQSRKTAVMAKQKQMANRADLSANDKANPCGHPACGFVGKNAGRIESLT